MAERKLRSELQMPKMRRTAEVETEIIIETEEYQKERGYRCMIDWFDLI